MKVAEVKSRFDKVDDFIKNVEKFGFSLLKKNISDPAFYYFDFKKNSSISKSKKKKLPEIELKPCLYKHRWDKFCKIHKVAVFNCFDETRDEFELNFIIESSHVFCTQLYKMEKLVHQEIMALQVPQESKKL